MNRLLAIRRQMLSHPEFLAWQEYPEECWGRGNLAAGGNYNYYDNLLYDFPVLSKFLYIENNSGYNLRIDSYNSSNTRLQTIGVNSGIYEFPDNAEKFKAVLWDKPTISVVDSGLIKLYYLGATYKKPIQKPNMRGEDFLWCWGNLKSDGSFNSTYYNAAVRIPQPIQTRIMDIDLRQCNYDFAISFLGENKENINARTSYLHNNFYQDILNGHDDYAYYVITMYDKPTLEYARMAPFEIIFR